MPLIDRVQQDMTAAMKGREEARLSALRMIKAALMKQKVDSPKPLDEAAEMQVLKSLIKQRMDAAEMFRIRGQQKQKWAIVMAVLLDNMDHYGNLVVYARVNGIVPPRTAARQQPAR